MNEQLATILTMFLYALVVAVVIRALLSWFPISRNNQFARLIYQVTEPLIEPVRRVLPRTGMIDLSAMVVILLLYLAISVVNRAANA